MYREKDSLLNLFENNKRWVTQCLENDPEYFSRWADEQKPTYLWIGCSDSRILANEIIGLGSGDLFVHRNIANLVIHSDMNCLSVIQYALDILRVEDIIVCGHYDCGGVEAAVEGHDHGLVDNWLRHIRDVANKYESELLAMPAGHSRFDRLCELNTIEQAINVAGTTIVQDAWRKGRAVNIHAWMYNLRTGSLRALAPSFSSISAWRELVRDPVGAMFSEEDEQ